VKKHNIIIPFIKASTGFVVDVFHILTKNGYLNFLKKIVSTSIVTVFAFLNIILSCKEKEQERTSDGFLIESEDIGVSEADLYSTEPLHAMHMANIHHEAQSKLNKL
jgi:hypothetical protein